MGLSNVYGAADDEESKELLRHAIKIGQVSQTSPVALFGERPSENEVLNHPVYRYGFKRNPIVSQCRYLVVCLSNVVQPAGTQKPQGFKMVVISAGTDVGMFTSW